MKLLMLGGTGFVGRHITEAALDAGHEVTLFNRGKTNAEVFPAARRLVGDREAGDLAALATGEWDAVVDVNAYIPRRVREAVAALDGRVGHYTFISTVSVYEAKPSGPLVEGESALGVLDDPTTEDVDNDTYGPLKVLCEQEAQSAFAGRCTVIRPGIVAGPWDPTERFTHWVRACASDAVVRAPARPDQPVQVVHARDQADFVVKASLEGIDGVFNTVGPSTPLTFASMLAACGEAAGRTIEIEWVDEAAAKAEKLVAPLYLPSSAGIDGLFEASSARAEAAGLVNRPIVETAADTLEWTLRSDV
jgi:2'-hydroxyisoflavone reductase